MADRRGAWSNRLTCFSCFLFSNSRGKKKKNIEHLIQLPHEDGESSTRSPESGLFFQSVVKLSSLSLIDWSRKLLSEFLYNFKHRDRYGGRDLQRLYLRPLKILFRIKGIQKTVFLNEEVLVITPTWFGTDNTRDWIVSSNILGLGKRIIPESVGKVYR